MILNEGIKVRIGADNSDLLSKLKGGKLAAGAFATAVAASLASVAVASTKMAAQLDKDLRLVSTLGGEAAGNTERLRKEVQALGREFGRDFRTLATANYQAVSGGFKSIADSMELTRAGTKLAVTGNADLVGSTEAVVKALNAFDMSAQDADKAAAQLWGITRDGIITVEQLGKFLADLPVAAASSGIEFEEMSAAISTLTAQGVPASTAMDQIRSAIIKLEEKGITGSLVERVERFAGQGIGALTKALGDQTAARGVLVLAENLDTFRGNVEAAGDVTGDFSAAVETMNSGPMAEWDKAIQGLKSEMHEFGASILPAATAALEAFNKALAWYNDNRPGRSGYSSPDAGGTRYKNIFELMAGGDDGGAAAPSNKMKPGQTYTLWGRPYAVGEDGRLAQQAPADVSRPVRVAIAEVEPSVQIGGEMMPSDGGRFLFPTPEFQNPNIPGLYAPEQRDPDLDFIAGDLDFEAEAKKLDEAYSQVNESSRMAAASAGILSGALGGALTSALVTADSAVGRFVQSILAQFAQLGIRMAFGAIFGLPGFSRGGFTGSGGVVHENEYVFSAAAVRNMGVGNLERMHASANAGASYSFGDINVTGTADPQTTAQLTADAIGAKLRELNTTGRGKLYMSASQKHGGR
jgi:hypothetical protein